MLHENIVKAGEKITSNLYDAMEGHLIKPVSEYDDSDLIQKYIDDEISSVEAIYIAMKRAEEKILQYTTCKIQN